MEKPIKINKIITRHQTTETNSLNIQDIIQKQKKVYIIITLSSNKNSNLDLYNINNFSNNINENLNCISGTSQLPQNKTCSKQILHCNNDNYIMNGNQNTNINELINKFNI